MKKVIENMISPDYVFMLYTPSYGNSQLKMEILEFTSKEAAAPLMSLAAPLWFWKFFENFENYES